MAPSTSPGRAPVAFFLTTTLGLLIACGGTNGGGSTSDAGLHPDGSGGEARADGHALDGPAREASPDTGRSSHSEASAGSDGGGRGPADASVDASRGTDAGAPGDASLDAPSHEDGAHEASTQDAAHEDARQTDASHDAGPLLGPSCQVAPPGGFVGGPTEMVTFTGTATELSPMAGTPQALTVTITGAGIEECWDYDRCNAWVDASSNLWGTLGTATSEIAQFAAGVDGALLFFESQAEGCSATTAGSFDVTAHPRSTHFTGTYCIDDVTYAIALDAPAGTEPCTAVPNCALGNGTGEYCGGSIDGYGDTIYQCFGSMVSVVQTCPDSCGISGPGVGGPTCS